MCAQGTGQVLVNMMTGHRCQCFLCLWFMSSCHSTSPFICHKGNSYQAELNQSTCNHCRRLSDVSVFPLYTFCCWIFSAAAKKRHDFWRFNITGAMVNFSCTQWKHYTLSYLEIDYYCHYRYLYNFYKSLFMVSDWNPRHLIQRLLQRLIEPGWS